MKEACACRDRKVPATECLLFSQLCSDPAAKKIAKECATRSSADGYGLLTFSAERYQFKVLLQGMKDTFGDTEGMRLLNYVPPPRKKRVVRIEAPVETVLHSSGRVVFVEEE